MPLLTCLAPILLLLSGLSPAADRDTVAFDLDEHTSVEIPADSTLFQFDSKSKSWVFKLSSSAYCVSIQDLSESEMKRAIPNEILANTLAGMMDSLIHAQPNGHAQVKLQRDTLFAGWPGLIDVVQCGRRSAIQHSYLIGNRLYLLCGIYATSKGRPKDLDHFLDSLKITPPPAAGRLKEPGPEFTPYESKPGRFTVDVPSPPKAEDMPFGEGDHQGVAHRFLCLYGNRSYIFAYIDIPVQVDSVMAREKITDEVLRSFEADPVNKRLSIKKGPNEFDSIDFVTHDGMAGRIDTTVANDTAYVMIMLYPKGHAGSKDIDRFFSSLQIKA